MYCMFISNYCTEREADASQMAEQDKQDGVQGNQKSGMLNNVCLLCNC